MLEGVGEIVWVEIVLFLVRLIYLRIVACVRRGQLDQFFLINVQVGRAVVIVR